MAKAEASRTLPEQVALNYSCNMVGNPRLITDILPGDVHSPQAVIYATRHNLLNAHVCPISQAHTALKLSLHLDPSTLPHFKSAEGLECDQPNEQRHV